MTAHSKIGPSSAERWFACPASVAFTAALPPSPTNKYAAEGTVAHALAEELLTGKTNTLMLYERIGDVVEQDGHKIEITEEMVGYVEEYRDEIATVFARLNAERKVNGPAIVSKTEVRLSGEHLHPTLFGTGDHLMYVRGMELHFFDLKYGKSGVDADDNKQLLTYAVMAMDGEAGWDFPGGVFLHIFQPRARDGNHALRTWKVTPGQVSVFKGELEKAAKETENPKAKFAAGDWCYWCVGKASCLTTVNALVAEAQTSFTKIPAEVGEALRSLEVLPIEQVATALGWKDRFDAWFKAAEARIEQELSAGRSVPGYKLVPGRRNRQWRDEAEVIAKFGAIVNVYEDPKIKSPAALEKLVGKKAGVDDLTFKPEAPLRLAKDNDPRTTSTPSDAAAKAFAPIAAPAPALSLEEELGIVPVTKKIWP